MRRRRIDQVSATFAVVLALWARPADAQGNAEDAEPTRRQPGEEPRELAKAAFERGTRLVADAKWADALAAFEEAQSHVPHAITIFNIGACERALGRYTAARQTLRRALQEHESKRTTLPATLVDDANAFLLEIDKLIARVEVTAKPKGAALLVDGRPPLVVGQPTKDGRRTLVAGVLRPDKGLKLESTRFLIELDPGRHVLTFVRPGFSDGIVVRDFRSGVNAPLDLRLNELPATITISADKPGALVTLAGKDLGPAPITIQRPAGTYDVLVEKDGHVKAEAKLTLKSGEQTRYRATLPALEPGVAETWWFWTIAGVAVTGVAVGTYFLARPEPEPQRATIGGGSLGWRVPLQ